MKTNTTVSVDYEVLREARERHINISQAAEDGIKANLEKIRGEDGATADYVSAWKALEKKKEKLTKKELDANIEAEREKMIALDKKLVYSIYSNLKKEGLLSENRVEMIKDIKQIFYEQYKAKEAKE